MFILTTKQTFVHAGKGVQSLSSNNAMKALLESRTQKQNEAMLDPNASIFDEAPKKKRKVQTDFEDGYVTINLEAGQLHLRNAKSTKEDIQVPLQNDQLTLLFTHLHKACEAEIHQTREYKRTGKFSKASNQGPHT